MRRLAAVLSIFAIPLAWTAAATADTVSRTIFAVHQNELFGYATFACGFDVNLTIEGSAEIIQFFDDAEKPEKVIFTTNLTLTAMANGKSLAGKGAGGEILTFNPDGSTASDHQNGIAWKFVLPGSGVVLQFVGQRDFVNWKLSGALTAPEDS